MADINEQLIASIQMRALLASEDEIFSGIGTSLPREEQDKVAAAASLSVSDLFGIGRDFYHRTLRPVIEDLICGKIKYCANRSSYDTATSVVRLVAEQVGEAIVQAHSGPKGAGEAAGKLLVDTSAAVLKEGLNKLCHCPNP